MSILELFTNPVLYAPTVASMLMCMGSSIIGVIVLIRKRTLVGEALSHASYPGVVISTVIAAWALPSSETGFNLIILLGAFASSMLGLWAINGLKKLRVKTDAALCFVLSVFFGIGILIASRIQTTHSLWYKQAQLFLYGQAATMTDLHVAIYGCFALVIGLFVVLFYRHLQMANFDIAFAQTTGSFPRTLTFVLLALAIVIGMRSVGVVLMSGMLIAPAVAARQLTHRLSHLFLLAPVFGMASALFGNYLSVQVPRWAGNETLSLPTGPMILVCAASFCFTSILFLMLARGFRMVRFRNQCHLEHHLKRLWKQSSPTPLPSSFHRLQLKWQGAIEKLGDSYQLTSKGKQRAANIVRMHRLWEVYLVDYLGQKKERVHRNAEELEHFLTPELENTLTELLSDPQLDPHRQPIPRKEPIS